MVTSAAPIIRLYHERKIMKKLGITQNYEDVEGWEISAYSIIEDEISKIEELERKKK